jgi:acyl-CoA synthetase (AMP-forming)/AMP-acid ligase II
VRSYNLADLFEGVVDARPGGPALVCRGAGSATRRTYAELDARVNRLSGALADRGIGVGDHVGLGLYNGHEYVESMLALFKLRAVPVNVNYRYGADELRYLFADADLKGLVADAELSPTVDAITADLPRLEQVVYAGDEYEALVASGVDIRPDDAERTGDDLYLLYTGGTTGMPKGVMWRHEDIFFASLGGAGSPRFDIERLDDPGAVGEWASGPHPLSPRLPLCPLMHGGAQWVMLQSLVGGDTVVLSTGRTYDARHALELLAGERVAMTMVIGDAVMRPIVDVLADDPDAYDLSALRAIASGGAILSPSVKTQLAELLPGVRVADTFGASETGGQGRLVSSGSAASSGSASSGPPRLRTDENTAVFDDDLCPIAAGSGQVGRLGRKGNIPLGYYRDPDKTATTFPTIDGVRWSIPGDMAQVEEDGTVLLLGRGAVSINTGGEKVYPEEVEGVVKGHPAVADAIVVGLPDERFGQRVAAVIALRPGADDPTDDELSAWCHDHISGYKVPRAWVRRERLERLPTGKADYRWAARTAETP